MKVIGAKWVPGKGIGLLTLVCFSFGLSDNSDSPLLRVKPISKQIDEGCLTVGVETYEEVFGIPDLIGTFHLIGFNYRDPSLAGRILLSSPNAKQVA
jgi:aspartyl aminopeptidase